MGGGPIPKIPDYRIYKVEDSRVLMDVQQKLSQHGLKDPWLRNEVWRYTMKGIKDTTHGQMIAKSLLRGFPQGVMLAAGLICAEKAYHTMYPPADGGGHH